MNLRTIVKPVIFIAISVNTFLNIQTKPSLKTFHFKGAGVLPIVKISKNSKIVILSREAHGKDKGTWDVFGGKKERNENHPVVTASREFTEESGGLFIKDKNQALKYIDIDSGNTDYIIANENKNAVTYITNFTKAQIINFFEKFYYSKTDGEKDKICEVDFKELSNAIANAKRDLQGKLLPVKVKARVAKPKTNKQNKRTIEIHNENITLRPFMVSQLQTFFKDLINGNKSYIEGKNPKIRFYKN